MLRIFCKNNNKKNCSIGGFSSSSCTVSYDIILFNVVADVWSRKANANLCHIRITHILLADSTGHSKIITFTATVVSNFWSFAANGVVEGFIRLT